MNSPLWVFVNKTLCRLYGGSGGHRELKEMIACGGPLLVSPRVPYDVKDPSVSRLEETGKILKREVERRRQQTAKRHADDMAHLDAIDVSVDKWIDDQVSAKRRRDDIAGDEDLFDALDDYVARLEVIT
ncbi:MAG: hypothetical protein NT113_06375 [Hyphomicrobiales bacterium]|jgi:hypothetical protein|nr:hypothetical protein [Hyphomicrobiales bacterium]